MQWCTHNCDWKPRNDNVSPVRQSGQGVQVGLVQSKCKNLLLVWSLHNLCSRNPTNHGCHSQSELNALEPHIGQSWAWNNFAKRFQRGNNSHAKGLYSSARLTFSQSLIRSPAKHSSAIVRDMTNLYNDLPSAQRSISRHALSSRNFLSCAARSASKLAQTFGGLKYDSFENSFPSKSQCAGQSLGLVFLILKMPAIILLSRLSFGTNVTIPPTMASGDGTAV